MYRIQSGKGVRMCTIWQHEETGRILIQHKIPHKRYYQITAESLVDELECRIAKQQSEFAEICLNKDAKIERLEKERDEARAKALEEAASLLESHLAGDECHDKDKKVYNATLCRAAEAIRALKESKHSASWIKALKSRGYTCVEVEADLTTENAKLKEELKQSRAREQQEKTKFDNYIRDYAAVWDRAITGVLGASWQVKPMTMKVEELCKRYQSFTVDDAKTKDELAVVVKEIGRWARRAGLAEAELAALKEERRWRSVEDELPDKDGMVWVVFHGMVELHHYDAIEGFFCSGVKAWMPVDVPMPTPPEGD